MATRPWSFPASAMPVIVTTAYLFWEVGSVNWGIALWTLINIILFHAAGNTWSDYHDYMKGVDREDTFGGMSITSGQFAAKEIRQLAIILLTIAIISGLLLTICTGLPTLYCGLAGAMLTLLYPWMKFHALGDINIFLIYSLLSILGTSFVTIGYVDFSVLWLTIPIGLITVGILHINNTRDIEHDGRAGITTFAMLIGKKASVQLYCFEILFPFVWIVVCAIIGIFPYWSVIVLVALKPAIENVRQAIRATDIHSFTGIDERTAMLQLQFSLLLTLSMLDTLVS